MMFRNADMPMVHMSLDFHFHKVDSTFLFAINAAAVVSCTCSDPKKCTDDGLDNVHFGPLKSARI